MKNILILTTVSGFLNKFERDNVCILQKMGYTVHYAANKNEQIYVFDEKDLEAAGIILHHIDIAKSPYLFKMNYRAYKQLINIVEENDIHVIHCHTPVGGLLGRLVGRHFRKQNLKVIYTAHGFHFYKGAPLLNNTIFYMMERLMAPYTDILILINEEDYRNACRFPLKKGGKVYKIPGVGLDLEKFNPLSHVQINEARKKLGLKERDFFIVSVGELNENKNHEVVLKALAKMKALGKNISHIKYGICGNGFFRERLMSLIKELHLESNVTLYGYCQDVREILGCAQASVFPSIREGLGMAALESLAMGIPVIAADNRGTREYMQSGKNGYVCAAKDIDGYIRGIEKIGALSDLQRRKVGVYCRESVKSFEKINTNRIMESIYHTLEEKEMVQS